MSRLDRQREKMLAETFHGEWAEGAPAKFAQRAAAAARRHQACRRVLLATGAAAGIAATVLFSLRQHEAIPLPSPAVAASASSYEVISDADLLAELKDRPLLVICHRDRSSEFVLLDDLEATEASEPDNG